jgi:hypothetical protein
LALLLGAGAVAASPAAERLARGALQPATSTQDAIPITRSTLKLERAGAEYESDIGSARIALAAAPASATGPAHLVDAPASFTTFRRQQKLRASFGCNTKRALLLGLGCGLRPWLDLVIATDDVVELAL